MVMKHKIKRKAVRRTKERADCDLGGKIVEVLKYCMVGDTIVFSDSNGYVFKIKLEALYPPNWHPPKKKNVI